MAGAPRKDFFISYTGIDHSWAEWIAWALEDDGYSTIIQAWDFRPGTNFVQSMQQATAEADRTIAVLSPDYLVSAYAQPEWQAAFTQDPTSVQAKLLPVRVRDCTLEGLLRAIVYIDLVGQDETGAQTTLLAGVSTDRAKPPTRPSFPGAATTSGLAKPARPRFPG